MDERDIKRHAIARLESKLIRMKDGLIEADEPNIKVRRKCLLIMSKIIALENDIKLYDEKERKAGLSNS